MFSATSPYSSEILTPDDPPLVRFHPSMWGFNTNGDTPTPLIEGDNRPVVPLYDRTFDQWWFHGLLSDAPEPDAILQMPVGQTTVVETVCDKGASTWWNTSAGHSNVQTGDQNYPCRKSFLDPGPVGPPHVFFSLSSWLSYFSVP